MVETIRPTYPPIVAITGRAGHGKSTVADYLVRQHGYTKLKFADPLKQMLRVLGLTDAHLEGALKEVPTPLLGGQTPRHAMVTLGTEWGRELIHADLWVDDWCRRVAEVLNGGGRVVCDDLRFLSEEAAVDRMGGYKLRVERPDLDRQAASETHQSETEMVKIKAMALIHNGNNGVERLFGQVEAMLTGQLRYA